MSNWIKWNGGAMPVRKGTPIKVKHRDGNIFKEPAGTFYSTSWEHYDNHSGDIVEYQVMPESVSHWGLHSTPPLRSSAVGVSYPTEIFNSVTKPKHYNHGTIECITYLADTLGDGASFYYEGNVKKYLHRFRYKNGLEDLKKAEYYLKKLIETMEKK